MKKNPADGTAFFVAVLFCLVGVFLPLDRHPAEAQTASGPIRARAGGLDHFSVVAPETAVAGRPYAIRLQAFDAYGNLIQAPQAIDGSFRVEARGSAVVDPTEFTGAAFADGAASFHVVDTKSETTECVVLSEKGFVLGRSNATQVLPGALERFHVLAPTSVAAGQPTAVRIEAVDRYDNLVPSLAPVMKGIALSSTGTGRVEPATVGVEIFQGGIAAVQVTYRSAETMSLKVESIPDGKTGQSESIRIMPGLLKQMIVTAPQTVTAGEPFQIQVEVFDSYGNPLRSYNRFGSQLMLNKTGQGQISPRVVEAGAFSDGKAAVDCTTDKVENFVLTVFTTAGDVTASTSSISVMAGRPVTAEIQVPERVRVRDPFPVRIRLIDRNGNDASGAAQYPGELTLRDDAGLIEPVRVPLSQFATGVAAAKLTARSTGRTRVMAEGTLERISGESAALIVIHGALSQFTAEVPRSAVAGEPFDAEIHALDAFGNPVLDYGDAGKGVDLAALQGADMTVVSPSAPRFSLGLLKVSIAVKRAGPFQLRVQENGGTVQCVSQVSTIFPSRPDRFDVIAPDSITAGLPFTARIRVLDRYGNLVEDYDRIGIDVILTTGSSGTLTPNIVHASRFNGGVAEVNLTYDKAENFTISASFSSDGAREGPILPPPLPTETAPRFTPPPQPPAEAATPPPSKPAASKPPAAAGARATPPAAGPAPAANYEVDGIEYREKENEARIRFRTTGLLNCRVTTEMEYNVEWLRIVVWPVRAEVGQNLNFRSSFFGEQSLSLTGDKLEMMLEILPSFSRITHRVERTSQFVEVVFNFQDNHNND